MLQNLTSLKVLDICDRQGSKFELLENGIVNLNALQELYLSHCENLKSLTDDDGQLQQVLQSLKVLEIVGCPKFNLSPCSSYLTSLEELTIGMCPELEGFPEALQYMTALKSLTLVPMKNLECLPNCLGNLCFLQELSIFMCPKLKCLPTSIQFLSGLKSL